MNFDWTILRDQIWDFVGVIIGIFALFATVIIYFLQKSKRALSYEIVSKTSLLSTKEKLEGKLKVLYNDILVQNIKIFEIKVINTGQTAIAASDYERPLCFQFNENSNVLATEVTETSPKSLTTELIVKKNHVIVTPVLMNAKDSIVLKIVVADHEEKELSTDVRIRDVKDIKKINDSSFNLLAMTIGLILTIVGIVQMIHAEKVVAAPKPEVPWSPERISAYTLIGLGYIIIIVPMLNRMVKRRGKNRGSVFELLIDILKS